MTIIGEAWVAVRPSFTSFGSNVKSELEKILNPSGSTGIGGIANKLGFVTLAATGAAIVASTKLAIDAQNAQASIQGSMNITAAAASGIDDAFNALGGSVTFSSTKIIQAFAPVAGQLDAVKGSTLSATDAVTFMKDAIVLADASNHDLAGNTSALSQILQSFQIKLKGAGDAANTLYTTSTVTAVPIGTLSTVLSTLHMRLGTLDPSLRGIAALMVDLAEHGTIGSRGVRAVTSGLEHLVDAAAKAPTSIAAAVKTATSANETARFALENAVRRYQQLQITDATQGTGNNTVAAQFALQNAQLAVSQAREKATEALKNLTDAEHGNQATSSSATATLAALHVSLYNANHQFIGFRAVIEELEPKLRRLHGAALELALSNLFGAGAAQQMNKVIQAGGAGFDKAYAAVTRHNAAIKAAAAFQHTIKGRAEEVRAAVSDLGTAFGKDLLPYIQDVEIAVADVIGWFLRSKGVALGLALVVGPILGAAVLHYVGSVSVRLGKALSSDVQGMFKAGKAGVQLAGTWAKSVSDTVRLWGMYAREAVANAASSAAAWAKGVAQTIASFAKQAGAAVVSAARQTATWIAAKAEVLAAWATQAAAAVADAATTAAAWAASAAETVATWAAMAAEAVADAAIQVAAWAAVAAAAVAAFIAENAATLGIAAGIALLVAAVIWMATHWKQTWNAVRGAAEAAWHFLDSNVIQPIEQGFKWLIGQIQSIWSTLTSIFMGPIHVAEGLWRTFTSTLVRGVKDIVGWFEELPSRILHAVANFGALLIHAGLALMDGLRHGIAHGFDAVRHGIAHVADNIVGAFTSGFGIFSPSKVTYKHGEYLMQGLANGITGFAHLAISAVRSLHLEVPDLNVRGPLAQWAQFVTSIVSGATKVEECVKELETCVKTSLGAHLLDGLAAGVTNNANLAETALRRLGLNVPNVGTGPTGGATAAVTVQHQLLTTMRELVTVERQNTQAVQALTVEERKVKNVKVSGHGGTSQGARRRELSALSQMLSTVGSW